MHNNIDRVSAFYNPNDSQGPAKEHVGRTLDARKHIVGTDNLHDGYMLEAQLYKEIVLLGTDSPEEYIPEEWQITDVERTAIEEDTFAEVINQVHVVLNATEDVQSRTPRGINIPSDLEAAGMVCAYWAHHGRERLNGGPYYEHPASVSEILRYAWHNHHASQKYVQHEKYRFDRLMFLSLVHDTFEDDQMKDGLSFLDKESTFRVTPLFVKILFDVLGRDDGDIAADSLVHLTKVKQPTGNQTSDAYRAHFAFDPDAILIKIADNRHNGTLDQRGRSDIEPRTISRNVERRIQYGVDHTELMRHLGKYSLFDQWTAHAITAIDKNIFDTLRMKGPTLRPKNIPDQTSVA